MTDPVDYQSDSTDARLIFRGSAASIVAYVRRDDKFFDSVHQVWMVESADNGSTWGAIVPLPNVGGNSMGTPVSIAAGRSGRVVATAQVDCGNNGGTRCGQPKLIRRADAGGWSICAPETKGTPTRDARMPTLALPSNDRLDVVFLTLDQSSALKPGLALWRETMTKRELLALAFPPP